MIAEGAMAFNSLYSPNAAPYRVPQILVTLISEIASFDMGSNAMTRCGSAYAKP
jgi:hypothetical protein